MSNNRKKIIWTIGVAAALIGAAACGGAPKDNDPATVVPNEVPPAATTTVEAPPPAQPVSVSGQGATVTELGATLNGKFKVDYSTEGNALIVKFMKADGSDGAGLLQGINELDFDKPVAGSKVVDLTDVTMVETDNVDEKWTLTFTPLG